MSDDQVLSYIAKETQRGSSQSDIAAYLVGRGVTMTQLQRVRRKAERLKAEEQTSNNAVSHQEEVGIIDDSKPDDKTEAGQDITEESDQKNERQVSAATSSRPKTLLLPLNRTSPLRPTTCSEQATRSR